MAKTENYKLAIDNAALMTRLALLGMGLAAVGAGLILILGVLKRSFAGSDTFAVGVIAYAVALLFGAGAFFYGLFAKGAAIEAEEKALLQKRRDNNLLALDEDARFTQQRTFDNYTRFAPYVLAILGALLIAVLVPAFFRYWNGRMAEFKAAPENPMYPVFLAAVMMAVSIFGGAFFTGQSREKSFRWLRPFGAWLIAGAISSAFALAAAWCTEAGKSAYDPILAKVLSGIYVVLAAELVLSFVVEFYRPRTFEESRPVFESRLLALFTEPGGVMRNFADMLDYQFGFKVSSTWVYGFVERAIFPLLLIWCVLLWGFTAIHEVGPNEVGLRSNFGRLTNAEPLPPGIYFTLPWPFGTMDRYSCDQLYEVTIGHVEGEHHEEEEEPEDDGHGHDAPKKKPEREEDHRVVLWTAEHGEGNNNFIVANDVSRSGGDRSGDVLGDFYFVGMSMPIQYRIRPEGVMDYALGHRDAAKLLRELGQMVVTECFASAPFYHVITTGRNEIAATIRARLQKLADEQKLGVEIVSVNLVGIHPPTQVGSEFQKVLGAMEMREKMILEAQTFSAQILPAAKAEALGIEENAAAYSYQTATVAKAESERFVKQLAAYRTMPRQFLLDNYLSFLENDCRDVRKYVLSSAIKGELFELNLEEKERVNLFDSDVQ